jgi:hypothetical protein
MSLRKGAMSSISGGVALMSIPRGELAKIIYERVGGSCETLPIQKESKISPEVLKVCPRNCFVISTTRKCDDKSAMRIQPNSEVPLKQKNNRILTAYFVPH